jgi:protein-disulfide isomerase
MHTYAEGAAEAALAAYKQGKFWPYHDSLYAHQDALTETDLVSYAMAVGLDVTMFESDLQQGTCRAAVQADVTQGKTLGVTGTPTFFINGRAAVGALPYDTLSDVIEEELDAGN